MENIIKLLNQYAVSFELLGKKYTMPVLKYCEKYGEDYTKTWSEVVQYLNEELPEFEEDEYFTHKGGDWIKGNYTGVDVIDAFYTLEIVRMALMLIGFYLVEKSYNGNNTLEYEWRGREIILTVTRIDQ